MNVVIFGKTLCLCQCFLCIINIFYFLNFIIKNKIKYFQVKNNNFGVFGHRDASIKIFKNDALYSDFHSDIIYINKSTQIKFN